MISSTLMIFLIPDIATVETVFFGTYTYPFLLLTKAPSLWLKSSKGLASSMHNLSPYFNLALRCLFCRNWGFFGPQPRTLLLFRVQVTVFFEATIPALAKTFTRALAVVLRHITRKFSSDSLWNLSTSARFVLYCVALFKFSYFSLQFLTVGKCRN